MRTLCFKSKSPSFSVVFSPANPRQSIDSPAMDQTFESAAAIITKWNPYATTFGRVTSLFHESKHEAIEFIRLVNELKKEFYQILSKNRDQLDPESVTTRSSLTFAKSRNSDFADDDPDDEREASESNSDVEEATAIAIADLRSISDCMIASGYAKECASIYKVIRKLIIDEGIYRLGVEKASSSQVKKMPWKVLELKIKCWLEGMKMNIRTLFKGERILCDHVFESSDFARDSCFSSISKEGTMLLFGFQEIVAKNKKNSPGEKIFRLLDMYAAIAEKRQEIGSIFSFDSISILRSQVLNSLICLGKKIRMLLSIFESGLLKDSSKMVLPGGGVHPLTVSAMSYLSFLSYYTNVLVDILTGAPSPDRSYLPESYFDATGFDESPASDLAIRFAWLILVLLCKIDRKAKRYNGISELYLFLTNNLQHIVSRTRASNLKHLLGKDWICRHERKVRQLVTTYERLAWGPVTDSLPENQSTAPRSPPEAKERFENFNSTFESIYRKQCASVVPDPILQDEIKISLARKLVPIYHEFYNAHSETVLAGERDARRIEEIVTPQDICNHVSELFTAISPSGNPSGSAQPSSSSSHQWNLDLIT